MFYIFINFLQEFLKCFNEEEKAIDAPFLLVYRCFMNDNLRRWKGLWNNVEVEGELFRGAISSFRWLRWLIVVFFFFAFQPKLL